MADQKKEVKEEIIEGSQPSFAKEDPGEKEEEMHEEKEDLSMFERNLTLPDEGVICLDSNLQAVKYDIVYIMRRINRQINAWWKYNIALTREQKIANWEKGFRPEVTGGEYPVKNIDPSTGEPEKLTPFELIDRLKNQTVASELIQGAEHLVPRAYEVAIVLHKMMWAFYRTGRSKEDFGAMVAHNKRQTDFQLAQRRMLKGSARVVEMVMVQNDPSYSTMTKLLKMVTGCETFSFLSNMKSSGKHFVLDVEALVGDPMNRETDSELSLILNQYGLIDQHGPSGDLLDRLKAGKLKLQRQLVINEDYSTSAPQLAYDSVQVAQTKAERAWKEEQERKARESMPEESGPPRSFNPEGYVPPSHDSEAKSSSSNVGAVPKAHAAKARPLTPRQPPDPPPSSRMQEEKGKSQHYDEGRGWYDKGRSYQQPVHSNKGEKGKGKGKSSKSGKGYDRGYQSSYKGKGHGQQS